MITEDYTPYEIAKLLKEMGFEGENRDWYNMEGFIEEVGVDDGIDSTAHEDIFNSIIPAPTLQMAMKWLREVHNLHIMIDCIGAENYMPTIIQFARNGKDIEIKLKISKIGGNGFDSHEQAINAAIKYCLEKLI